MAITNCARKLADALLLSLIVLSIAGCGESGPTQYSVSGKVTFNGTPVTEGTVSFEDAGAGYASWANLDKSGVYTIELPAGDYTVVVEPPMIVVDGVESSAIEEYKRVANIPEKYHVSDTSGLTANVNDTNHEFDFDLKP